MRKHRKRSSWRPADEISATSAAGHSSVFFGRGSIERSNGCPRSRDRSHRDAELRAVPGLPPMKFHAVHGRNVSVEEGGCRARRTGSFCDALAFSHKPLPPHARLSLLLAANTDWTGALRLGATTHDPATLTGKRLPRYACPALTARPGFWARPLPEKWAAHGNRLTFYVNGQGEFHLFVNKEHKGAVLTGLPAKEQLWILLDLYGITVSAKFVSAAGSAPSEVIARGPEAVQAYRDALRDGSAPLCRVRLALVGPDDGTRARLLPSLVRPGEKPANANGSLDTSCVCRTSEEAGQPWVVVEQRGDSNNNDRRSSPVDEGVQPAGRDSNEDLATCVDSEACYRAIAANVVRELLQQRRRRQEERRKTPLARNPAFRLPSTLARRNPAAPAARKEEAPDPAVRECQDELPTDLPQRVAELVDSMLRDSEAKPASESREDDGRAEDVPITFHLWNYGGEPRNILLHQLFFSPQTIFLFVFDLSRDLEAPSTEVANQIGLETFSPNELSVLSLLRMWLELIHVMIAYPKDEDQDRENTDITCPFFPPVLIVGVIENLDNAETEAEHQFNKIKESLQDKAYSRLVQPVFYRVGPAEGGGELRKRVEELCLQLPHLGSEIPLKWLLFEHAVDRLLEREVYFADINKLSEVARLESIDSDSEFFSMVHSFHRQGKLWHPESDVLRDRDRDCDGYGTVVLKPQWFVDYIYQMLQPESSELLKVDRLDANENEETETALTIHEFQKLWPNAFHHTSVLLRLLDIADLLFETKTEESDDVKGASDGKQYHIPWLSTAKAELENGNFGGLVLVLDFNGLLPVGFFTRLVVRLWRWSKRQKWTRNQNIRCKRNEIPVDYNHSMKLWKVPSHRIKVALIQRRSFEEEEGLKVAPPSPHVCSKIRHLLERETLHLRDVLYKRLSFGLSIPCPCERVCPLHRQRACPAPQCLHLLPLDKCLQKKVLDCDFRSVKTDFIQRFFFSTLVEDSPKYASSVRLSVGSLPVGLFWGEHDVGREEFQWLGPAAKMLTSADAGRDWRALAKRLGYSAREMRRFEEETLSAVSLLDNWTDSNGRTRYCVDLLVACLEQMDRSDVVERILQDMGPEPSSPPVFLSYQWEAQEAVLHLRRRIELAGYPCWMDVGHLSGGDALYGKIYEGISKAKIVVCCLTPRYALSPLCTREMSLADVLRKPIVPVMLEPTPWPPPGALALLLSPLVYVDLCGIGGHGGCGLQADWESRFLGIVERVSHFAAPAFPPHRLAADRCLAPPPPARPELDALPSAEPAEPESDATVPDDEDATSVASSSTTPPAWDPARRNRVTRCAVCLLL